MHTNISRRIVLRALALGATALALPWKAHSANEALLTKIIPSSGESLPLIGLGSWITFNVGRDARALDSCAAVIKAFFEAGGRLIDSSPMYASSQPTIGYGLESNNHPEGLFAADKVWTSSASGGASQIEESRRHWGVMQFDLLQVHNLLAWEDHLNTLFAMKAAGNLRYVGVTTSHGRRHGTLERIMTRHPIDFIQITYNAVDREVEKRILPLARERGIAVIVNRPFRQGRLIRSVLRKPLPSFANEAGAANWPEFLLKFIVSHPAITCAIPATTRIDHVQENMAASTGAMPDAPLRRRMADYVESL